MTTCPYNLCDGHGWIDTGRGLAPCKCRPKPPKEARPEDDRKVQAGGDR